MTLTNYWWLLIWMFIGGGVLAAFAPKRLELVFEKKEERWRPFAAFLLMLPFIIWAGFRTDSVVGDTESYRNAFEEAPEVLSQIPSYLETITKDKGFYLLTALIKVITSNSVVYFLIIAAFQLLVLVWLYRKYSCNYWLSIFLVIASTDYMSWAQNGIRQFMAITICLLATPFMLKRKYISAIVFILLASTMHQSALIMIPIMFIVQGKPWNKRTISFMLAAFVAIIFVSEFTNWLDTAMQETQYANMVTDWTEWEDDGTNPLRVLVYSIPMILSIVGLKYVRQEADPVVDLCVNMSIITSGIYLISMMTSGLFLGRLPAYCSFYNGILLPWEIEHIFTKDSAKIIKLITVASYCAFFYYQMHFSWGLL